MKYIKRYIITKSMSGLPIIYPPIIIKQTKNIF